MIPVEEMETGEWYDGFVCRDGRQAGVATLQWLNGLGGGKFYDEEDGESYLHVEDADGWRHKRTFEPNVRSVHPYKTEE